MAKRNNFPKNNNAKPETKSEPVEDIDVEEEVSEVEGSEKVEEKGTTKSEPVEENFGLKIIGCKSLRIRKTPEVKDDNVDRVVKSDEMLIGRKYNADWTILKDGNFVMSKFVVRAQ